MKPILITLIMVALMISISIQSGLTCKEPKQDESEFTHGDTIWWSKTITRADGCKVDYSWIDPKGEHPFTKDTCCLDSVVYDIWGLKNYQAEYIRDSTGRVIEVVVTEIDSTLPY